VLVLNRLGRDEEAEELATSQIRICDNAPELLEDAKLDAWNIVRLYSLKTGDPAKLLQTYRASLELEAKINGPFHPRLSGSQTGHIKIYVRPPTGSRHA